MSLHLLPDASPEDLGKIRAAERLFESEVSTLTLDVNLDRSDEAQTRIRRDMERDPGPLPLAEEFPEWRVRLDARLQAVLDLAEPFGEDLCRSLRQFVIERVQDVSEWAAAFARVNAFLAERFDGRTLIYEQRSEPEPEPAPDESPLPTPAGILRASPAPVARFPTGLPSLDDEATRGGLPTGALVFVVGLPDAGKTGFVLQIAERISREPRAVVVLLTPDQGAEASAVRLGMLLGLDGRKLEARDEAELAAFEQALSGRPLFLEDDSAEGATTESVIAKAEKIRPDLPHVLCLDSAQEAPANAKSAEMGERERTIANVRACQKAAKSRTVPWLVIVASQTTKAAGAKDPDMRPPGVFAGAETAKIGFAPHLILLLEGDPGKGDGRATVVKNKLGGEKPAFGLRLDRGTTRLEEIDRPAAEQEKDELKRRRETDRIGKLGETALELLRRHGPLNVAELAERIGGRRTDLLTALDGLEAQGAATWTKGPRNARIWEARAVPIEKGK